MEKNCVECLQPITNPLCMDCYLKQIDVWLKSIDYDEKASKKIINSIRKKIDSDEVSGERCIKCGKQLSLCSYCFFFKASLVLRDITKDEELMGYYSATFNYIVDEEEIEIN